MAAETEKDYRVYRRKQLAVMFSSLQSSTSRAGSRVKERARDTGAGEFLRGSVGEGVVCGDRVRGELDAHGGIGRDLPSSLSRVGECVGSSKKEGIEVEVEQPRYGK